jgi:5'-3' exonuclease
MIVHFDADLIVYRAGFAAEKMVNGSRNLEPVSHALYNAKCLIEGAIEDLHVSKDEVQLYLSGSKNFRDQVATIRPYKGNRDKAHKPTHGPALREYMQNNYKCNVSDGEEADDVVGYSHYAMHVRDPESTVICSVDKDLDMIPGYHYNFVKKESYYVSEEKADWYFLRQLMTGDPTDNIVGIPQVGKARAEGVLNYFEDPWEEIVRLYVQSYGEKKWYDALVENGRLLWIRRKPNEMWNPPERIKTMKVPRYEDVLEEVNEEAWTMLEPE